MNNKPTYLSKDGLEKLRSELDEMVSVKRPEVANRIHDAKEHGDLSENAEYEDAKNEQAFVEGRIQTLEALIKNATIIDENHSTDHVQIGSTVAVESPDGKEAFTIVGSAEAKPAEGRISNESPVGRALLGKLIEEAVQLRHRTMVAQVAADNAAGRRLHAAMGFKEVGVLHEAAHKFNVWMDITLMERSLKP